MTTPTLTAPPDAPSRLNDTPDEFRDKADAFAAWWVVIGGQMILAISFVADALVSMAAAIASCFASQVAAAASAAAAVGATHYVDTSATNFTPTLATLHAIALDNVGDLFANGDRVDLIRLSDPTCNATGLVSGANMAGKTFNFTPDAVNNAGLHSDWLVRLSALGGASPGSASDVRAGTSSSLFIPPMALIQAAAFITLTDAPVIAWDTRDGFNAKVTVGGDHQVGAPTHLNDGLTYTLDIYQNGAGGHTITFDPIWDWGSSSAPEASTAAGAKFKVIAQYSATTGLLEASARLSS